MRNHDHSGDGHRRGSYVMGVVSALVIVTAMLVPAADAVEVPDRTGRFVTPTAVVAPPNGMNVGFAPNVLAIAEGGSITLVGADLQVHNLTCVERSRKTKRPLCNSTFVNAGQTAPVVGVEKLPAGTYPMVCQLHPKMTVNLRVL